MVHQWMLRLFKIKIKFNLNILETFLLLITLIFITNSIDQFPFQKKVWVYWNTQISQAPLQVSLCHQKISKVSKQNGFQYIVLNDNNLKYYISNYQSQFVKVMQNSQRKSLQAASDLIRIAIIQQHGGIYFDISAILLNNYNLNWLQNLQNYQNILINKISKSPEILFFTYCNYQSNLNQRNNDGLLLNQNPGFQIWFIAAKKNSQLIKDWKKNYFDFTQNGINAYSKLLSDENIFIRNIDLGGSYWSANLALYYTLQTKQRDLDKQITLSNVFFPRKSTYEYYKTWGLQSEIGPSLFERNLFVNADNIFEETIEQIESRTGQIKFFIKINSVYRNIIHNNFQKLSQIYKEGNFNFDQYLLNKPNVQDCNKIKFVTEGSFIDKQLISNSKIIKQYHIKPITLVQREKWQTYCSNQMKRQLKQFNFYHFLINRFPVAQFSKITQIRNWNSNLTLFQKNFNFFTYNKFILWYFGYFNLLIFTFLAIILFSFKLSLKIYTLLISSQLKRQKQLQMQIIKNQNMQKNKQKNRKITLLIFMKLLQLIFGILLFYENEVFNYTPKIYDAFFYNLFAIIIDLYIKNQKYMKQNSHKFLFKKIIILCESPINYFLCYAILSTIQNRTEYKIFHSIIISLIGPSLYNLILNISKENTSICKFIKYFHYLKGYHKKVVIVLYSLIVLIPNIRFYVIGNKYIIQYSVYLPFSYVILMLISLFYYFLKQKKKQINSFLMKKYFLLIVATILSYFIYMKIIYVKNWWHRIYSLSLVCAFTYIYILSKSQIKQIEFITKRKKIITIEDIILFGLSFYYLGIGTYFLNYERIQNSSIVQAFLFLINIGIFLAFQKIIYLRKKEQYKQIDKKTQVQIASVQIQF